MRPRNHFPLYFAITGFSVLLIYLTYRMVTPVIYRELDPAGAFNYVYVPPSESQYEWQDQRLEISAWGNGAKTIEGIYLYYRLGAEGDFQKDHFEKLSFKGKARDSYIYYLPKQTKGKRYYYYLEMVNNDEEKLVLKARKTTFERLLTGPGENLFSVRFKGRADKWGLIFHIALTLGSVLFLIHSIYFAISYLLERNPLFYHKNYSSVFWGWLLFTISVLPLGYYIAYQSFGVGWGGWPFGNDITDNKSQLTVLFWGVIIFLKPGTLSGGDRRRDIIGHASFAWLTLAGAAITVVVYLIPHSLFLQ